LSPCDLAAAVLSESAFTIVGEDGREIPAEVGLVGSALVTSGLRFDVSEDFTTGTLRIAPGASQLVQFTGGELAPVDPGLCAWIAAPAEQTVAIHLTEAEG
jgi:hypothetical protein